MVFLHVRILGVYFYIHDQKSSLRYELFPFDFFDTGEITEIFALINKLKRVKLTKHSDNFLKKKCYFSIHI